MLPVAKLDTIIRRFEELENLQARQIELIESGGDIGVTAEKFFFFNQQNGDL